MEASTTQFDPNTFKRAVKEWMRSNPQGDEETLRDVCEEMIPPTQFSANRWLIDQTIEWYRHVVAQRKKLVPLEDD